jgi:glycine cleavage system aminomethyltransferase T
MTTLAVEEWRRQAVCPERQAEQCRTGVALFDFSFMSVLRVTGPDAASLISGYARRDISRMSAGDIRYCLHADPQHRVRSDLTVWKIDGQTFEVMSGEEADAKSLVAQSTSGATVEDISAGTAIFAVQGPLSLARILPACEERGLERLGYFSFCDLKIHGVPARIGRLGYTGERGFELVVDVDAGRYLWDILSQNIDVAGFAAADVLRIEAGFSLFCNEFSVGATAQELGMSRFVDGPGESPECSMSLVCFSARAKQNPVLWQRPPGAPVNLRHGELLVTSACFSSLAGSVLGLGYVTPADPKAISSLIDPLRYFEDITIRARPFFDPQKKIVLGGWDRQLNPLSSA